MIAAYDPLPELDTQLAALRDQDYAGRYEVIVSDNAGSAALEEHLQRYWSESTLVVRWLDSSARQGTAYARTVGGQAARYDFIAYADQDDRAHESWLSSLADTAQYYDLVGGRLDQTSLNESDVAQWRDVSSVNALPVCADFLPFASGCNFGLWRDVFDAIDGWDADFVPGEDIDICWRAQLAGYRLGYAENALMAYRFRTGIRDTWRQSLFYQDGETRLARQYRDQGARRRPLLHWGVHLLWVALRCPLLPGNWSRSHRGKWAFHAGIIAGRIKGSLKYRVFYP